MKTCTKCGETKSLDLFHKDKNGKNGLEARCKSCSYLRTKNGYANRPWKQAKSRYGLSEEDAKFLYNKTITDSCETCGRSDIKRCIDHCHVTGKIRGILCDDCNTALGRVLDSTQTLRNLVAYLER